MKKSLLSLLVGFSVTSQVLADDLLQVYQQALKHDPATLQAKAQKDSAYSLIEVSRARLLPSLDLEASAGKTGNDADRESNGATLRFSQSIYDASRWAGLDKAELSATQEDARYSLAQQNLILRTVNSYFDVLQAKDDLEFAQAEKRAIERQLEQTKQRFEVGLTAITDVHEAQALFDNAVAAEISAQNNVEIRLEALREITNQYHSNINVLDKETFSASALTPSRVDQWLTMATERNFELAAAKIGVDIAKQDIDIANAGHYPTLDFTGNLKNEKIEVNGESDGREDTYTVGLTLNVPIYSGGATSANVETERNNFVVNSEERERVYRSVVRNVRSNFYDVTASISRIKALSQSVVSAESALKATEAGFEVGTRTIVDVLNSTRNLYDAKRNLSGARYDYIKSTLNLKLAAGSLTEQDVRDINKGLTKA